MKVHGYATQQAKAPLSQYSFERRDPRNNDVVIDIQYCGICHTDIHQVNDEWGGSTYPMVPGHEIVGIVEEVGPNVTLMQKVTRWVLVALSILVVNVILALKDLSSIV
jgi:uncharacterized zinc-type alcohol dehydrogenase-like protein